MKTSSRQSKKNLLALGLSFLMVASGASAFAACGSDDNSEESSSSSSSSSTTVNSDLKITNSDFETFNTNNGLNVIGTSASGWTRSTSSTVSSKAASGIVNLSKWDEMTTSAYDGDVSALTVDQAKQLWKTEGALTVKDKLAYYDAWKAANSSSSSKIATELKDFYEAFNIDSGDLPMDSEGKPLANPLTHDYKETDGEKDFGKGTNVLMIHNQNPEVKVGEAMTSIVGAAQKYTSSTTITVQAGTAATFSVWVKTADLKVADTEGKLQNAVNKGAFINVTHSVGNKSLPVLSVKNIDTKDVTDNNGWKQYTFYLKGSAYTDTTFSIALGLGMGSSNHAEYVSGYAFFDDIECSTMSYDKYDVDAATADKTVSFTDDADAKTFAINGDMTIGSFALNLSYGLTTADILDQMATTGATATSSPYGDATVTSQSGNNVYAPLGDGFSSANDVTTIFDNVAAIESAAASNEYLKAIYNNYFVGDDNNAYDFAENEKILMLLSADGVAYTWDSGYDFEFKNYTDKNGATAEYLAISFFVKTSNMNGFTGAGVTLKDGYNKRSFTSIDTSSASPVKVDYNLNGEADNDVNDGWQQYFFFVKNDYETKADGKFSLSFNFGPTTITGTTKDSYYAGFAAFTNFQVYPMDKTEYDAVSAGSFSQVVSVNGTTEETAAGNAGFDSAANVPSNALKEGLATPMNYTGVYSDSRLVNQANGTHNQENNYAYAGLLNKDNFAEYFSAPQGNTAFIIEKLKAATGKTTADEVWNTMFGYNFGGNAPVGSRTQPLLIWNDGTSDKGYGFVGNKVAISANTYTKISLAVKVGALNTADADNVFANIYLVDMDDTSYSKTLSIGRNLTYWYDDKGNICTDEECETVAFNLQTNGLYLVNTNWKEYKALSDEAKKAYSGYFANLEAYEKDSAGNLIVADGGAARDYNSYWNNQGLDGIAYYYNQADGLYYAEYDGKTYSVPVNNLKTITKTSEDDSANLLPYRYLAEDGKQLMATVGNTNGAWTNVTFYIHTGSVAKNYRLEVWSGDRNGAGNPADTYVAFDTNYVGDASTQFPELVSKYEEDKTKYETDKNAIAFENVFSWYDSAYYLRYNKSLDENKYGDLYVDSYVYSTNVSGVAYLEYQEANELRIFADYSFQDVTVTPAAIDDGSDDSNTSEEETTDTESEMNFFMLFSSIAIAAILVLVIAIVVVRKILEKTGKMSKFINFFNFKKFFKKNKTEKTVKASEKKASKKASKKAKEELDEDSPYND